MKQEEYQKEQNLLTDKELATSYWYVTHKEQLEKAGVIALAIVAGFLFLYGAIGLILFYSYQNQELENLQKQTIAEKINYAYLQEKNNPMPVEKGAVHVLKIDKNHYDIVVNVTNANSIWYLSSFDYYFLLQGQTTNKKTAFLLPGESKYLMNLAWESSQSFSTAELILENLKWQKQADYESLKDKILQVTTDDIKFVPSKKLGIEEKVPVSQVQFKTKNDSAYNFFQVDYEIVLFRGSQIVGVTKTFVKNFRAGDEETVKVNFYHALGSVDSVLIVSEVDILNPDVFMGFE